MWASGGCFSSNLLTKQDRKGMKKLSKNLSKTTDPFFIFI
ncbi:hypothetical protein VPMS16_2427 [Vibrio sp. 16]|nr:hypothetical protein VPMS16_2427 [Vibrio sp. 16]